MGIARACIYMCVCVFVAPLLGKFQIRGPDALCKLIAVSAGRAILFPRADVIYLDDRAIYPSLLVADCCSRGGPEAPSLKKN